MFEKLPNELLILILIELRSLGVRYLASALRVSKTWYDLGERLLWRHVTLDHDRILPFVRTVTQELQPSRYGTRPIHERIQSLTINTSRSAEGETFAVPEGPDSHRVLHELTLLLPNLNKLRSFSFYHFSNSADPWSSYQLTDENVLSLIEGLPASVENLTVKAPTVYFLRSRNQPCLCELISQRIEVLHSLRLMWPRLCPRLLQHPSSNLRKVVIDTCRLDMRPNIRGCDTASSRSMSWDERRRHETSMSKDAVTAMLGALKTTLQRPNLFPRLTKFIIFEPYHFPPSCNVKWFILNVHSMTRNQDDNCTDSRLVTKCFPAWVATVAFGQPTGGPCFIIRQCMHETNDSRNHDTKHDCAETDIIGQRGAVLKHLESDPPSTSDKPSEDIKSKIQCTLEYQAYRNRQLPSCIDLRRYYRDTRVKYIDSSYFVAPDDMQCESLSELQYFHQYFGVRAKDAGADSIWWLESKLGHSAIWAREFEGGLYQDENASPLVEADFTSIAEQLRTVQRDAPYIA